AVPAQRVTEQPFVAWPGRYIRRADQFRELAVNPIRRDAGLQPAPHRAAIDAELAGNGGLPAYGRAEQGDGCGGEFLCVHQAAFLRAAAADTASSMISS